MTKSLFEQLGGTYHKENGYFIPDLRLHVEEEQSIGTWGQRHLDYLKQFREAVYAILLTSGKLKAYLSDIDRQAQERFERLIESICAGSGTTAVAALNTGRRFVCFETAPAFYAAASERIHTARVSVESGEKGV